MYCASPLVSNRIASLYVVRVSIWSFSLFQGSPASQTDIEPFFDFVVSVEQGLLGDGLKVRND